MSILEELRAERLAISKQIVAEGAPTLPSPEEPGDLTKVIAETLEDASLGEPFERVQICLASLSIAVDMLGYHKHAEIYESAKREVARAEREGALKCL
jgi:hypothetical protein